MMTIPIIRYRLETASPLKEHVIRFVLNSLGVAGQRTEGDEYELYYGTQLPDNESAIAILSTEDAVLWDDLIAGKINAEALNGVIPFDIIGGIAALLTDEVNEEKIRNNDHPHHYLDAQHSFQGETNILTIPVVNLYVNLMRDVLWHRLHIEGIPLFPDGKKYAIGLSHDVDRLQRPGIIRALLYMRYSLIHKAVSPAQFVPGFTTALMGSHSDDFARFRDLMRMEEEYGFRSTYFFFSMPFLSNQRASVDILYDIEHSNFQSLFRELKARDFEIGLHASYNAYQAPERFVEQKIRLETIAETNVRGLRHHYWHVGPDAHRTLRYHDEAGFDYDTSLAYWEEMGFRRGSALPFHPWDTEHNQPINVMQLPVFCMDGHLFYKPGMTVEMSTEQIKGVMQTIKQFGGIGVVDWHSDTSHPQTPLFEAWGAGYESLLRVLANDSEAWVTNLSAMHDWFEAREKRLTDAAQRPLEVR